MKQGVDFFRFCSRTFEVQLFRDELFEVHPGAQGRSFICGARVQGAGDEFTESYVVSMNIKLYLADIVTASRMWELSINVVHRILRAFLDLIFLSHYYLQHIDIKTVFLCTNRE